MSTVKTVRRQDPARTLSGLCQDSVRTLSGLSGQVREVHKPGWRRSAPLENLVCGAPATVLTVLTES